MLLLNAEEADVLPVVFLFLSVTFSFPGLFLLLNVVPPSLTVIKTFSFASSCLSEIFQFCGIIFHSKF